MNGNPFLRSVIGLLQIIIKAGIKALIESAMKRAIHPETASGLTITNKREIAARLATKQLMGKLEAWLNGAIATTWIMHESMRE
jgi:hypothetical protein